MGNRNNGDPSDIEFLRQQSERPPVQDVEGVRSKLEAVQVEVAKLEKEVEKWKTQVAKVQADLEASKHQIQTQQAMAQNQERSLAQCQSNLRFSQSKNEEMDALLKARTAELEGAQTFLSKADLISDADATWKVQSLNTELCQAASFIADEFEKFSGNKRSVKRADVASIDDSTGIDLPPLMIEALKSTDHSEDPMNLMLALQIVMVQRCKNVVEAWVPGDSASNWAFGVIYRSLHSTQLQAVAGRWRALTRAHSYPFDSKVWDSLVQFLADDCVQVLLIAGCGVSKSKLHSQFYSKFQERLQKICQLTFELKKAIDQDITSVDLTVATVHPGSSFEPSWMDDALGDAKGMPSNARVFRTTEIGLRRTEKVGNDRRHTVLMKPKVLFDNFVGK